MNSKTDAFIKYDSFPVIGDAGKVVWNNPSEFLGGISCMSTTVLGLLESVQPGMSTLSTGFTRGLRSMLISSVNGLGNPYVSTSHLMAQITELTQVYSYISSTSFYDCVKGLSNLETITYTIAPMILFLQTQDSNFAPYSYINTVNPGGFRNYYSTLGFTGGLNNASINSGVQSLTVDLGGFQILASSKLRLDINANVSVTYTTAPLPQSIDTNFSTFLQNGTRPVGTPVVVNYSNMNFTMSKFTYFLTAADLTSRPLSISMWHRITNFDNTNAKITVVPTGVSATLINMD